MKRKIALWVAYSVRALVCLYLGLCIIDWSGRDGCKNDLHIYTNWWCRDYRGTWHVMRVNRDNSVIRIVAYAADPLRETGYHYEWGLQWKLDVGPSNPTYEAFARVKPGELIRVGITSPDEIMKHYERVGQSWNINVPENGYDPIRLMWRRPFVVR